MSLEQISWQEWVALPSSLTFTQYAILQAEVHNVATASAVGAFAEASALALLPAIAFEMMLGGVAYSDDQAREYVKNENTLTGFSQGLIMGILGWRWHQVDTLFLRHYVLQTYQRQELNDTRVQAYNVGVRLGYLRAAKLPPATRKGYLAVTRKVSGATPGAWTQRDQIDYVIDLAGAFRRMFMPYGTLDTTAELLRP